MTRQPTWRGLLRDGAVVLAVYLLFLVIWAPATLLDSATRRATAGQLRLAQAQGSLWSGHGQLELRDSKDAAGVEVDLAWTLHAPALLRGRLDYALTLDHAARPSTLRISARRIELTGVDFALPARALGIAVPRIAALGPGGDLHVHIAKLTRVDAVVSTDAVATWRHASSALSPIRPLGSYELRLDSAGGSTNASLRTLSGPLQLEGDGTWRGAGPPDLVVRARVDAGHRAQLAPLLRLIAVERGDGDFVLQFTPPLGSAPAATKQGAVPREPDSIRGHPTHAQEG